MPVLTSHALNGPDSRDSSIRLHKDCDDPHGRRRSKRFPIKLPVRYLVAGESGRGQILNIGSRGALFTTDPGLSLHARVELYIEWPVLLHNSVQLNLIVSGTVIWVEPGRAAIAIEKHEFRTSVAGFFQSSESVEAPSRKSAAHKRPSKRQMLNLPCAEPGIAAERALLRKLPTTQQRKVAVSNERWERVFQEKFADPEYYTSRRLPHSSPV